MKKYVQAMPQKKYDNNKLSVYQIFIYHQAQKWPWHRNYESDRVEIFFIEM